MFKKLLFSTLLLAANLVYANTPVEMKVPNQLDSGSLVINNYDDKVIPESVSQWVPWVKKDNAKLNCPVQADSSHNCVFIPRVQIEKNNNDIIMVLSGSAYSKDIWVGLPTSENLWPKEVEVNGRKSIFVEKQGQPYVQVNSGDFKIRVVFDSTSFMKMNKLILPVDLVSFTNSTELPLTYSGNILSFSQEKQGTTEKKENTLSELKVFRKWVDNVPIVLDTQIKIVYSGPTIDMELGAVLPKDFTLLNATTDLKLWYKDGKYYTQVNSGEHTINFSSTSMKNPEQVSTLGLVKGVQQEIWAIALNPAIRQLNIGEANQVDARQAAVPEGWQNLPSYIVKESIKFKTEHRGIVIDKKFIVNEDRQSWYGYNGSKMTNHSVLRIDNRGNQFLPISSDIGLESFTIGNSPQMLVKSEQQNGIIVPYGQFSGTMQTQMTGVNNIPTKFFQGDVNTNSWSLNLAPRFRLLGGSGVEKVSGSWIDQWNLYSIFTLFIISFAFYRLFGLSLALLSGLSILIFQDNAFLSWYLWIGLLITTALLKGLHPEKNLLLSAWVKKLGLLLLGLLGLMSIPFIIKEIRLIVNPSLELLDNSLHSQSSLFLVATTIIGIYLFYKLIIALKNGKGNILALICGLFAVLLFPFILSTTPSRVYHQPTVEENRAYPASAPEVMMEKSLSPAPSVLSDMDKQRIVEKNKEQGVEEKIQVGSGVPTWRGRVYQITINSVSDNHINLWIAPPLLVNLMAILQMLTLILTFLVFTIYLCYSYNKNEWVEKVPLRIRENLIIRWLLNDLTKSRGTV